MLRTEWLRPNWKVNLENFVIQRAIIWRHFDKKMQDNSGGGLKRSFWSSKPLKETLNVNLNKFEYQFLHTNLSIFKNHSVEPAPSQHIQNQCGIYKKMPSQEDKVKSPFWAGRAPAGDWFGKQEKLWGRVKSLPFSLCDAPLAGCQAWQRKYGLDFRPNSSS